MLTGLTLSKTVGQARYLDVAPGASVATANMILAAGVTKRLDTMWQVGSGGGALDGRSWITNSRVVCDNNTCPP